MKRQVFSAVTVLALVFGFAVAAPVRAEFCGDIAKLQQEAQAGKPQAQMELSSCYDAGKGVAQDERLGSEWLHKAVEQGYAPAQATLGFRYLSGRSKDEQLADQ